MFLFPVCICMSQQIGQKKALLEDIKKLTVQLNEKETHLTYWLRANDYLLLGEPQKAVNDLTRGITIYNPTNPGNLSLLYVKRSKCFLLLGNVNQALIDSQTAIDWEEKNGDSRYKADNIRFYYKEKAAFYTFLGEYEMAQKYYTEYTEEKHFANNLYEVATAPMLLQNYENAAERFSFAKRLDAAANDGKADYFPDYENMENANKLILQGNYLPAIEVLKRSFSVVYKRYDELKLRTIRTYSLMGDLYARLNQTEVSLDCFQKILVISPNHVYANKKLKILQAIRSDKALSDITAPLITLYSPVAQRGQKIQTDQTETTIFVKGRAEDPSGIKWVKVNGKLLEETKLANGFFEMKIPNSTNLELQACDGVGNISKIYSYSISKNEQNANEVLDVGNENYYALLVACSNYSGKWPPLSSTLNEARGLNKLLSSEYKFITDTLFDSNRIAITEKIASFVSMHNKPTDNLIIFFAGHGTMEVSKGEPSGYLVPLYAQKTEEYISRKDIAVLLNRSSAKHVLFITDACLSEFMRGELTNEGMQAVNSTDYNLPSRQLLTSSGTKNASSKSVLIPALLTHLERNTKQFLSIVDLYGKVFKDMAIMKDTNPELPLPTLGPMRLEGDKLGSFYFRRN